MNIKQIVRDMKFVYPLLNAARRVSGRALMRFFHATHGVEPDTVLFSSYVGHGYSDNTRCVSEALHAARPDLRIVWQFMPGKRPADLPEYIHAIPARSLQSLKAYSTAGVFVDNMNRPQYMLKFDDQLYIQTWHGDRGFKKIMIDMGTGEPFPDGRQMDLAVSGSDFGSRVYRSAFGYQGEILQCGCPRNDVLFSRPPEAVERARKALGIDADVRVLMYAPTYRNAVSGSRQPAAFDIARVRAQLERTTGEKWICITRGHDQTRGIASDAAMDVTDYPEVSDLLLLADMLISDYSSIAGDYLLLGRPTIYFQPDRDAYLERDRQLYFDPDESPLLVAHSEEELLDMLSRPIDGEANCRDCLAYFGCTETGHATEAVVARMLELMDARRGRAG